MAGKKADPKEAKAFQNKVIATNRRAHRDYEILDTLECGMVLRGSEVKSLRTAKVQLADAYAFFRGGELWLKGMHISPYSFSYGIDGHDPERERKLLAHRHQLDVFRDRTEREQLTMVPLSLLFSNGRAKVELGLVKGRRDYDKRQVVAKRDAQREIDRTLAAGRRGE